MLIYRSSNQALVAKGASSAILSGIQIQKGGSSKLSDIGIVVTGVGLTYGANVAYFTTLSESVYIYPLGNKIGKCMISGLALPRCSTSGAAKDNYTNFAKLIKFYNASKASNFQNITSPITITIGSTNIIGYLEDMQINISSDADRLGIAQFGMTLSIPPETASSAANP